MSKTKQDNKCIPIFFKYVINIINMLKKFSKDSLFYDLQMHSFQIGLIYILIFYRGKDKKKVWFCE